MGKSKVYTPELFEKVKVLKAQGKKNTEIEKELGLTRGTVWFWVNRLKPKRIAENPKKIKAQTIIAAPIAQSMKCVVLVVEINSLPEILKNLF